MKSCTGRQRRPSLTLLPALSTRLQKDERLARDDLFALLRAFRALDPEGAGTLNPSRLAALLASDACPEPLTEREAAAAAAVMAAAAGASDKAAAEGGGAVDYEAFALLLATDGREL
jgi:Ca2+-binding EF-hand superfamily protein